MRTKINHVTVVTMDEQFHVYENGYVVLEGNTILETGEGEGPADADGTVDGKNGILMPGMINTHCHIPMIPFRSLGDDCPDRLRRFLFPLELEAMNRELIGQSTRYGVCELLLSGVTSVLDMYYFEDQVAAACEEMGIRVYVGQTIIDMETCDSKNTDQSLAMCEELIRKWKGHERIRPVVAPHATNTNPPEVLKAAYELAERYDVPYTLHVSEMDYELEMFREKYDQTPAEFLYGLGVLGERTIAAHCIHMTDRDVEIFPVLSAIFEGIFGECPYKSPTDMGVNMNGFCIMDDEACREASRQEIIRRYYQALGKIVDDESARSEAYKIELIMKQAKITPNDRPVVPAALSLAQTIGAPAAALELPDGKIVLGKTKELLGASAAVLLNAIKELGGIDHDLDLISPESIAPIQELKVRYLGSTNPRLHTDEVLIALSTCAATDQNARTALEQLPKLRGCQVHTSVLLSDVDTNIFKKLGIELTCEPVQEDKK